MARIRAQLGFYRVGTRYGFTVRRVNRKKRREWAKEMKQRGEMFMSTIFTDESMIEQKKTRRHCYVQHGYARRRVKAAPKHRSKVIVVKR